MDLAEPVFLLNLVSTLGSRKGGSPFAIPKDPPAEGINHYFKKIKEPCRTAKAYAGRKELTETPLPKDPSKPSFRLAKARANQSPKTRSQTELSTLDDDG